MSRVSNTLSGRRNHGGCDVDAGDRSALDAPLSLRPLWKVRIRIPHPAPALPAGGAPAPSEARGLAPLTVLFHRCERAISPRLRWSTSSVLLPNPDHSWVLRYAEARLAQRHRGAGRPMPLHGFSDRRYPLIRVRVAADPRPDLASGKRQSPSRGRSAPLDPAMCASGDRPAGPPV